MSQRPYLTVRLTTRHDGYEIVDDRGVVKDTVTMRELVQAKKPDVLISRRVAAQQRVMRVRRFAQRLKELQEEAT